MNKIKQGSCGLVLSFLSALFFVGCSSEEESNMEKVIAFDCSTSNLRAAKTSIDDMQYFRVTAIWDKGDAVYESFMDYQLVEKQGNNWVYSPIKYLPAYGTVSFFAYSPATSSGIDDELFQINNTTNQISIGYTVSDNYQKQEDFIVATNLNKTANPIQLNFVHVLSVVKFQARSNVADTIFRIKEIKLANMCSKGVLTGTANGATSTWAWQKNISSKIDYVVYQRYPIDIEGAYMDVGDLMVLPQVPESDTEIIVVYDIVGTSNSRTSRYKLKNDFVFEMGKEYTFYISL